MALARGIDAALAADPPGEDLPGLLRLEDVPAETTELYRFFLGKVKDRAEWRVEVPGAPGEEPSHEPAWQALYRPLLAILAAGRDGVAVVWDTSTWTEMASFTGDTALTCGAISATGEVVLGDALGRLHVLRIEEILS